MTLSERIQADLKEAMRAGEALRRDTLRMLLADLKNRRIELGREPDEAEVEAVLRRGVKTRRESIEQFSAAGRPELAAKEEAEVGLIERYLPQQMSPEEIRAAAKEAIAELGAGANTGAVMKVLKAKHGGRYDGRTASEVVKELLG